MMATLVFNELNIYLFLRDTSNFQVEKFNPELQF